MKFLQLLVKTVPFYLPTHYKFFQPKKEQGKQYWNEIAVKFLKWKHNADTTRQDFPIEMYMEGSPYKPYFIVLTLQRKIIIKLTKKIIILYVVENLVLLD